MIDAGEFKYERSDFAASLGWSVSFVSKLLNQSGAARGKRIPLDKLFYAMAELNVSRERLSGTAEYIAFSLSSPGVKGFIDLLVAYYVEHEEPIQSKDLPKFFRERGVRLRRRQLDKVLACACKDDLLGDPAVLAAISAALQARPGALGESDGVLVDRLVEMKIANPYRRRGKHDDDGAVRRDLEEHLDGHVDPAAWKAIAPETRAAVVDSLLAVWRDVMFARLVPKRLPRRERRTNPSTLDLVAAHLPPIAKGLRIAATSIRAKYPAGQVAIAHVAGSAKADKEHATRLLLGLAAEDDFPEAAKALRAHFGGPKLRHETGLFANRKAKNPALLPPLRPPAPVDLSE